MVNKSVFKGKSGKFSTKNTDTVNKAGGVAYSKDAKDALAQFACTGTFYGSFYSSPESILEELKSIVNDIYDNEFIAKLCVYSRNNAFMKDFPAYLTVVLASRDKELFKKVFPKVIDNGRMLRNFVQIARSGEVDNKVFNLSSGSIRNVINKWFRDRSCEDIFKASIGNDPTIKDIIKMARPKPENNQKAALYAYFLQKPLDENGHYYSKDEQGNSVRKISYFDLPQVVKDYEDYKAGKTKVVPNVDFRFLDSLSVDTSFWKDVAKNANWQMTRMNLNTFARHGVFKDDKIVNIIKERLSNEDLIKRARQFPFQIMSAYFATEYNSDVPFSIREALQDAMEISINNVPEIKGKIYVAVDCSGSMGAIFGNSRQGSVTLNSIASLIASSLIRKNGDCEVYTFDSSAVKVNLNNRDSVFTNMEKLRKAGGGTNVSSVLKKLNEESKKGDAVIYISDYESWLDSRYSFYGSSSEMENEWVKFNKRNPNSKLVCIDLAPSSTSQISKDRKNVLQVGGFSDEVFNVIKYFLEDNEPNKWLKEISKINI